MESSARITQLILEEIAHEIDGQRLRPPEVEAAYNRTVALAKPLLCVIDFAGRIVATSPNWKVIVGWGIGELEGRPWLDFIHPADQSAVVQSLDSVGGGKAIEGLEIRFRTPNGTDLWLSWNGHPDATQGKIGCILQDISRQKERQAELEFSESRFLETFDAAPIGMALIDLHGRFVRVNDALCRLLGFGRASLLGSSYQQLTHPGDLAACDAYVVRQLAGGSERYEAEKRFVHQSGRVIPTLVSCSLLRDASGKPTLFLQQVRDISKRRFAEAALQESDQRFEIAFTFAPFGMALVSIEGRWLKVNCALCGILGYSDRDLLQMHFQDITHPEDIPASREHIADLLNGRLLSFTGHKRYWHRSGRIVWALISCTLVRDLGGKPLYFVTQVYDETERRRNDEVLRESEERFRFLSDHAPVLIWTSGADHQLTYVNRGWLQFTGRTFEQELSYNGMDRIHPSDRARVQALYGSAFQSGVAFTYEFRLQRWDGEYRWLLSTGVPMRSADGVVRGYVGSCVDISERKDAQDQLQRAKETAEAANRSKGDFLAVMSHEIRTPMNGILGFVNLLLNSPLSVDQRKFAHHIRNSGEGLLSLINAILDFSKIEAGKMELEQSHFNLQASLDQMVAFLRPLAVEKGLFFNVNYPPELPRQIFGDAGRVRQVLLNLTGNAIKFTQKGGVDITVAVTAPNVLRVSVRDTGVGIPEDKIKHLFIDFNQLDISTNRRFGGSGLGLAISKRLISLMGGEIGVESQSGVCSTFWFTLPLVVQEPGLPVKSEALQGSYSTIDSLLKTCPTLPPDLRVLVAEDNVTNQLFVIHLLKKLRCGVDVASNGKEAVRLFEQIPFDLVLMDCYMPEMDGFEATLAIRQLEPRGATVPILALTASVTEEDRIRSRECGMNGFIEKPLAIPELIRLMHQWTQNKAGNLPTEFCSVDGDGGGAQPTEM